MRRRSGGKRGTGGRRAGVAAAEFIVVLPVLLTIVLACVDFGAFAYRYIQVGAAARAGATYGAMNPFTPGQQTAWEAQITETARDEMFARAAGAARRNRLRVTPTVTVESPAGSNGFRYVRVVAQYDFNTIVSWPFIPNTISITGVGVMRSIR